MDALPDCAARLEVRANTGSERIACLRVIMWLILTYLNFGWHLGIHQGRSVIGADHLTSDPGGVLGTHECGDVANVFRSTQASHRRPTFLMPVADKILGLF